MFAPDQTMRAIATAAVSTLFVLLPVLVVLTSYAAHTLRKRPPRSGKPKVSLSTGFGFNHQAEVTTSSRSCKSGGTSLQAAPAMRVFAQAFGQGGTASLLPSCSRYSPWQSRFLAPVRLRPNPSLNLTRYGKRRKPGLQCAGYSCSPGLRRSPPRAG
jgi:hypothetical protein